MNTIMKHLVSGFISCVEADLVVILPTPVKDVDKELSHCCGCTFDDVTEWNKETMLSFLDNVSYNGIASMPHIITVFRSYTKDLTNSPWYYMDL